MSGLVIARIVLDILGSLVVLVSVWNLPKHRAWWLVYMTGCLMFTALFIITKCPVSMLLELTLVAVGIKNYRSIKNG